MNTIRKAIQTGYRLTNLNDYPAMSQETTAYTATITKHGQEVGTIRNDGRSEPSATTAGEEQTCPPSLAGIPEKGSRRPPASRTRSPRSPGPSKSSWATCATTRSWPREVDAEKGTVIQDPDAGDWLDSHTYQVSKYGSDEVIDVLRSIGGWQIWDAEGGDFRPIV